eukprot:5789466-Ditylum_brightwellii.AAC.1
MSQIPTLESDFDGVSLKECTWKLGIGLKAAFALLYKFLDIFSRKLDLGILCNADNGHDKATGRSITGI